MRMETGLRERRSCWRIGRAASRERGRGAGGAVWVRGRGGQARRRAEHAPLPARSRPWSASQGVATGALGSTAAGTKTVSATIDDVAVTDTATVTVTAGSVSASRSTVVAAPGTIAAGNGTATITVTAKDANGNLIAGATVVL